MAENAIETDAMTLARVQRWIGKFDELPESKVPFAVKACDFLLGVVAFQAEQIDRMKAVERQLLEIKAAAGVAADVLAREASRPTVSYRVRITRR